MSAAPSTRLVTLATQYLAERRAMGFDLRIAGQQLLAFARYADEHSAGRPLTIATAVAWARAAKRPSPLTWAHRLETVRPFARYLRQFDAATEVPPAGLLGRAYRRLAPHVYTDTELIALLREARRLPPTTQLRPRSVTTILGLVAATGLRISEALHLRRDDVDLQAGLLHVRATKFRKSRLVPLHPSVVTALQQYADHRDRRCPTRATAFFLVDGGRPLRDYQVHHAFHRIRIRLGWEPAPAHQRLPRIHDLRHTFACRRLLQWHRAGVDVEAHLVDLSTYLGHVKVTDTYWYLSGFPELLDFVGQRFERFARTSQE